ncbi:putative C2 domain-containing protein [Helianthus anomalus]
MDYRILDLILVCAKGLKKSSFIGRMDVYAVASISGTTGKIQKLRTTVDKNGDTDPTWNFPMKFIIDEPAALQNNHILVVKIKAARIFRGKNLGEVHVPIKDLLDGVKVEGKSLESVSYQVIRRSGEPKGVLSFWYEVGEKFTGKPVESVTVYPPPPPPPPVPDIWPSESRINNSGMGLGTGLIAGF